MGWGLGGVKGQGKKGGTFSEEGSLENRGNNVKKAPTQHSSTTVEKQHKLE